MCSISSGIRRQAQPASFHIIGHPVPGIAVSDLKIARMVPRRLRDRAGDVFPIIAFIVFRAVPGQAGETIVVELHRGDNDRLPLRIGGARMRAFQFVEGRSVLREVVLVFDLRAALLEDFSVASGVLRSLGGQYRCSSCSNLTFCRHSA
jgi:hypothetical protein